MDPLEASLVGAEQIGFTILSLTVSLIAVLIPLLVSWATWWAGLFREFAVTPVGDDPGLRGGVLDAHADDVRPALAATASPSSRAGSTRVSEARFRARDRLLRRAR